MVNHALCFGGSDIAANLLILAGTTEASALADAVAAAGVAATMSFAGRVAAPRPQQLPMRTGGFGGVQGLADYIRDTAVTHVIDATHSFAAQMSQNAIAACTLTDTPLIALTRPEWRRDHGDLWENVASIEAAVAALDRPRARVFLAVGRMHLAAFAANPQHFYLLRLVDPPKTDMLFPDYSVVVDRGPFREEDDRALMLAHDIDLVMSKNSGGSGAYAKIAAARSLAVPVIMIDRPKRPNRREVHSVSAVMHWIGHAGTARGV